MAYKSKKQQSKSNQSSAHTDSSFERSIGQLTNVVQTLTNALEKNPTQHNTTQHNTTRTRSLFC